MKTLILLLFITILPICGTVCLFFPRRIQEWAIQCANKGWTPKIELFNKFIYSKFYLFNVRFSGVVAFLMYILIIWGLLRTCEQIVHP